MESLQITWQTLLALCAGLLTLSGAVGACVRLFNPHRRLRKQVEQNSARLDRDHERLTREENNTAAILSALYAIINHQIDGNHIDNLKTARNRLNERIIEQGRKQLWKQASE